MKQPLNIGNIYSKKSLGQNFIIDENFVKKLDKVIKTNGGTIIVEIGPGKGALTKYLSKKKLKQLYLIEKDTKLAESLKHSYKNNSKVKVFNEDALRFDYSYLSGEVIIVGNLPFNVSSQLLMKWLKSKNWPSFYKKMILMFQFELGKRIISDSNLKSYGKLSVATQVRCKVKKILFASSNIFHPKPKVDGVVLEFDPIEKYKNVDYLKLLDLLNKAFLHRRKKIKTTLKNYLHILQVLEIDSDLRAENLSVQDYVKITKLS